MTKHNPEPINDKPSSGAYYHPHCWKYMVRNINHQKSCRDFMMENIRFRQSSIDFFENDDHTSVNNDYKYDVIMDMIDKYLNVESNHENDL